MRHAPLYIKLATLFFNRASPSLSTLFRRVFGCVRLRATRKLTAVCNWYFPWRSSARRHSSSPRAFRSHGRLQRWALCGLALFLFLRAPHHAVLACDLKTSLSSSSSIVREFSLKAVSVPTACGDTGFRPERRVSASRLRSRSCSRVPRHARQRACTFCRMPSFSTAPMGPFGPLAQACAPEKENLVVMNKAVNKSATATRFAPMGLKPVRKPPETNVPSIPPGGTVPRTSGKCHNVSSDGSASNKSA